MSITYKDIDPESGIRWCVRAVFLGDSYGLDHCLTYSNKDDRHGFNRDDNPLIEFYDMDSGAAAIMRNSDDKTEAYLAEEYGQFVSRYYFDTLNKTDWSQSGGLNLDGGVDRWSVSGEFMVKAMDAIKNELKERVELKRREMQDA